MTTPPPLRIRAAGATHPGRVRDNNEDCLLIEQNLGLFGVFDGMGGHHAGEVASATARDAVRDAVRDAKGATHFVEREALEAALQQASVVVHAESSRRKARRGMGTTAVLAQVGGTNTVTVAHVGDSRAYLLRDGRLQVLTADHTIVAELLARGALDPDEARTHPYRAVLSRNLGAAPETRPEFCHVQLQAGDRLLLCSDGLSTFASHRAIEQTLAGAGDPDTTAKELIELALKGGGGDNVTAVVIEAGRKEVPRRTQIIRTSGANAWWSQRDLFLQQAAARDIARSPICAVLSPGEAVDIVAGNLCEAIYRDLEQTTGIHVWTYAENLVAGWLAQDGDFAVVRDLLDRLASAADAVVEHIGATHFDMGALLGLAVPRALLVAELASGGMISKRLREVEAQIVEAQSALAASESFSENVTVPIDVPRADPPSPAVARCLDAALELALADARTHKRPREDGIVADCLERAHKAARDHGGQLDGMLAARELFGTCALGEPAIAPLLDALDRARLTHVSAVKRAPGDDACRAAALRRIATAHRMLCSSTARIVVDGGSSVTDRHREMLEQISLLRRKVADNERRIQTLEGRYKTQPGWAPPRGEA